MTRMKLSMKHLLALRAWAYSLFSPASFDQFWVQYQEDMDESHENPISLGRKAKRNRLSWLMFQLQIHQPHQLFESWMISVSSRYDTWSSMKRNQIKSNQIKQIQDKCHVHYVCCAFSEVVVCVAMNWCDLYIHKPRVLKADRWAGLIIMVSILAVR